MTVAWPKPCQHKWIRQSVCHVYPHPRFIGGMRKTLLTEYCHLCGRTKCTEWVGHIELEQFDVAYKLDTLKLKSVEES